MKPRELRIGNYITPKWSDDTFVIDSIDNKSFYVGYGGTYSSRVEDLKPVPITKDWLLKFGFEEFESEYWRKNNVQIVQSFDELWLDGFGTTKLKFVHQLQNLYFALTGEELELKNQSLTNRSPANLAGD